MVSVMLTATLVWTSLAASTRAFSIQSLDSSRPHVNPVLCDATPSDVPNCSSSPELGKVCQTSASTMHPTQASLGMLLISCKTAKMNGKSPSKMDSYLKSHQIPAVIGPDGGLYITDHHHLARSLLNSNYHDLNVFICPQIDFSSASSMESFWEMMTTNNLVYLKDNKGDNITSQDIPNSVQAITLDDPFRSLSEYVRDSYGYIKCSDDTASLPQCAGGGGNPPFLEFVWGNLMRTKYLSVVPNIYEDSVPEQIQPLLGLFPEALKYVMNPQFSHYPHYNDGSKQPADPVAVDSSTGCESS